MQPGMLTQRDVWSCPVEMSRRTQAGLETGRGEIRPGPRAIRFFSFLINFLFQNSFGFARKFVRIVQSSHGLTISLGSTSTSSLSFCHSGMGILVFTEIPIYMQNRLMWFKTQSNIKRHRVKNLPPAPAPVCTVPPTPYRQLFFFSLLCTNPSSFFLM